MIKKLVLHQMYNLMDAAPAINIVHGFPPFASPGSNWTRLLYFNYFNQPSFCWKYYDIVIEQDIMRESHRLYSCIPAHSLQGHFIY